MYHCCHRRTTWGGGGGGHQNLGTTIFRAISFHFLGTDNDKIKIVGGNIIGKKLFICGKKYYREYQHFGEISEIQSSSWDFQKISIPAFSLHVHGGMGSKVSYCRLC